MNHRHALDVLESLPEVDGERPGVVGHSLGGHNAPKDAKQMPFDFSKVLAAVASRPVFINAPMGEDNLEVSGVKDCLLPAAFP